MCYVQLPAWDGVWLSSYITFILVFLCISITCWQCWPFLLRISRKICMASCPSLLLPSMPLESSFSLSFSTSLVSNIKFSSSLFLFKLYILCSCLHVYSLAIFIWIRVFANNLLTYSKLSCIEIYSETEISSKLFDKFLGPRKTEGTPFFFFAKMTQKYFQA